MKSIKLKKELNISKLLPRLLVGLFLAIGLATVLFGYLLFIRPPEAEVVSSVSAEIEDISIRFDNEKILGLFDSSYDTSNIKDPSFQTKDPFILF